MSKSGETHFSHIDQPIEYIRYLMMLTKNRPEPEVSNQISKALCYMFCRPNGLAHLVAAILDLDASSQRTTTHEQRFDAIGTVIAGLPSLDRSIQQYYSNICLQLIRFMKPIDERNVTDHLSQDTRNSLRTLAVTVCCALFKRRCRLFTQTFLRPLFECLEKGQIELSVICIDQNTTTPNLYHSNATISASSAIAPTCMLYIHEAIEIVSILLVRRFPIEPFVPQFAQLFYFYVTLHSTLSHLKGFLGTICEQLLSETPHSVLMLDDALFNQRHIEQAASYRVDRQSNQITLKVISKEFNDEQSQHQVDNKLQRVDCIVQCCSQLIRIFAVEQVIELFLLLLQRLCNAKRWQPDDDRRLILYSLIDSLQEQVLTTIIEHPTKAIIFINVTLDRIADSDLNDLVRFKSIELNDEPESGEAERAAEEDLHFNSMQMCLQLIESLLDKQLDQSEQNALSESLSALSSLYEKFKTSNTETKAKISRLRCRLMAKSARNDPHVRQDELFDRTMKDLESSLMPIRAHALINLKKMIEQRNRNVYRHQNQILTLLKASLVDPESYIYLSAINALTSLATLCTDEVLPILTNEFSDADRSTDERTRVAQCLVNLSKQLGDLAPVYAPQIMHTLLGATRSDDPTIRVSSLSTLAEFCARLRYALGPFLIELMMCLQTLFRTDSSIEVRRASVMFFHLLFNNLDHHDLECVKEIVPQVYRTLNENYRNTLDDRIRLHCQLALEQLDRIARQLLQPQSNR